MKTALTALTLALVLGMTSTVFAQDAASVNVNTADAATLAELPGIGTVKAEAIVEDREKNGDFSGADDISRVSGIGETTVEALRDQVEF
ncbi:ComEA family DNA-binding protein [Aidingimonas lacisalsi]|uniref:ComEA family DNA-binding protein n=1 Tax=Aidingimonas lacisalsi TaxID=2604086 RepID=UPI0011D1CDC2|nr:ComEA family DNA-binding protein [Aidingimonas lacisalsi]